LVVIDVARKLNLDFDGVWELIKASYSAVSVPSGEDEFELIPWVSSLSVLAQAGVAVLQYAFWYSFGWARIGLDEDASASYYDETPDYDETPEVSGNFLGLNQTGTLVFILLVLVFLPLCWIPWTVKSMKAQK